MALETVTYIGDLNPANPPGTDPKSQGDDHLRNIKKGLLDSLPGFLGLVLVTGTEAQGATASDYTVTVTPPPAAYTSPFILLFEANHASIGPATVQINTLGTKPLVAMDGSALQARDITTGAIVCGFYDGAQFLLISGNDRSNRGGDVYTGTHDFTAAAVEVAEPAAADNSANAAPTSYVDRADALKANLNGATYTGAHDFSAGTTKVATAAPGTNDSTAASTAFAVQLAFQAILPGQTGNNGKYLTTNGTAASWQFVGGAANILFGDGSDGDVTVSGAVTLSRDMYYRNLTLTLGAAMDCRGFRVFVSQTLDLTAAPAGAMTANGGDGGDGATAAFAGSVPGGTAGASGSAGAVGIGAAGVAGGQGIASGSATSAIAGTAGGNGAVGGATGVSGAGSGGSGGAGASGGSPSATTLHRVFPLLVTTENGTTLIKGGASGAGAAGGAGTSGSNTGGGGGGSGAGGGILQIMARWIARGTGTAAGALQARGGSGGLGGSIVASTTCGGGAGGAGGGGGWVVVVCESLIGASAANAVDVTGGNGGGGGNGFSSSFRGGSAGGTGAGGRFTLAQMNVASFVDTLSSAAAQAAVTTATGTGASAQTANLAQFNL